MEKEEYCAKLINLINKIIFIVIFNYNNKLHILW